MKLYSASSGSINAMLRRELHAAGAYQLAGIQEAAGGISGPGNAGYQKNGEGLAGSIGAAELMAQQAEWELPGPATDGIPR
jgi:hypothetical protein